MGLNLNKLRLFYTTIQAGSFIRAAELLHMSANVLGRNIRDLEKELGKKLYRKGYGEISLTHDGKELYDSLKDPIQKLAQIEKNITQKHDDAKKTLSIASSIGLGSMALPKAMAQFIRTLPDIDLKFATFQENLDLQINDFDVTIQPYLTNRKNLIQKELHTYNFYLMASQNYIDEFGIPKSLEDFKTHRIVKYATGAVTSFHEVNDYLEDMSLYSFFNQKIESNNPISEISFVTNDIAMAMIDVGWSNFVACKLIKILPDQIHFQEKVYFSYKESDKDNPVVDKLYNFLLDVLSGDSINNRSI